MNLQEKLKETANNKYEQLVRENPKSYKAMVMELVKRIRNNRNIEELSDREKFAFLSNFATELEEQIEKGIPLVEEEMALEDKPSMAIVPNKNTLTKLGNEYRPQAVKLHEPKGLVVNEVDMSQLENLPSGYHFPMKSIDSGRRAAIIKWNVKNIKKAYINYYLYVYYGDFSLINFESKQQMSNVRVKVLRTAYLDLTKKPKGEVNKTPMKDIKFYLLQSYTKLLEENRPDLLPVQNALKVQLLEKQKEEELDKELAELW